MTQAHPHARPFNYAAFKKRWRDGCKAQSIDPEVGPTSFTVSNLIAEQNKAAKAEAAMLSNLWGLDAFDEAEVRAALQAWLALGRWGWGVDLVEWGLIRDLLMAAIGLSWKQAEPDMPLEEIGVTATGEVELIGLAELWMSTKQELRDVLAPKQIERLPTFHELMMVS